MDKFALTLRRTSKDHNPRDAIHRVRPLSRTLTGFSLHCFVLVGAVVALTPRESQAHYLRAMEHLWPMVAASPSEDEGEAQDSPIPSSTKPTLVEGHSVPPFWIDRKYTTHRTRALTLPPLFFHRTPVPAHPEKFFHADLSLTFGWYSKNTQKRRWISPAVLFFGSFSERTTAWGAVPLLMGYKRVGEKFNFGQFPLVWYWGSKYVKNLFIAPLHYHQKTPDSFRGISGLLFWYGHSNLKDNDPSNDRRHFVAAPLFFRFLKGYRQTDVGIPLYVGGFNKLKGLRHRTLFPFFHWQSSEFGNRKELWTLAFVQRSDRARQRSSWTIPPLLTFQKKTAQRSLLSVTPLFWHGENYLKGSQTWVLGPYVGYRDPRQVNRVFAPLFWQFTDLEHKVQSTTFFPLVHVRKSPQEVSVMTLLAGGSRAKDGGFGFAVPPLFTFVKHRPTGLRYQIVTPLFWHFHNPTSFAGLGSDHVVIPPLFYRSRQGEQKKFGIPPLLTFFGNSPQRSYQVITPLFWHVHDRQKQLRTVVTPPVYVHKNASGWQAGVFPLAFFGNDKRRRYSVIPPLLFGDIFEVGENRRTIFSPFFILSKNPGHRSIGVLGLAWDVKRPDSRHSVVFPLYYRRQQQTEQGSRVLTITPLGGGLRTPHRTTWMAGPLYGTRGENKALGFGLVPLFFYDRRQTEQGLQTHAVLPPLFIHRRTPHDDFNMITPLIWHRRVGGEKPRTNLAIVPFYFRQRQPKGVNVDAGIPWFYSRDLHRRTHTIVAGPFFHRLSRTQLNTGIAPIYWWKDSEDERRLISLPLIVHHHNKRSGALYTIAPPLWFDRRQPSGRRTWVAVPFVVGNRRLHNFTRVSIAPPGYFDIFRLVKNYRFTGYVPLLFRYQKCGFRQGDADECRYTLWGSFPLFLAGKDGKGRITHSALSLYYYDRDPGGQKLYTWLGGFNYRPGEKLLWYTPLFGHSTTKTHKTTVVFPFLFRKAHRLEDRSTTLVLPPLFIGQRKEEFRWNQTALLVWHFRRPHKVATAVIPPLFYTSHTYAERRLTWLLPLFLRDNQMGKDQTWTTVFPGLYFQRRKGENLDFVQFPLVWHIERGENQGTMGAFVWWDIRVKGTTTQVVPGLFARRKSAEKNTVVLGPGLGWWTRKGEDGGKALHWRVLFGLFGGGNEQGSRYFSLFGAKIKLRPKPVWKPKKRKK